MLLSEIAKYLNLELKGEDKEIRGVNTLEAAKKDELSFLANPKYVPHLKTTKAGAVVVSSEFASQVSSALISSNPYFDFARVVQLFARPQGTFRGISELAFIHSTAQIDPTVTVYPFVYIGEGVKIGANTVIFSGSYIGERVEIGEQCTIYPNVSLLCDTKIGNNVIIHAGTVLGSDGFGFAQGQSGLEKFPQIGKVVVEDNVEIGANTTIDRAAIGETKIGAGTKIDNLVQIAHNVQVGENSIIVAQVGISGSTVLGKQVILGGQVGIAGHLHLGDGCRVAAQSGVGKDIPPQTDVGGTPSMPHKTFLRSSLILPKLPELYKKIKKLEEKVKELETKVQE
ncbi:MAG: UDP-3-O-(3-hydroxymyristoyl)glucosamine N-acyltransferase [Desulfonauticus sp.]|nr:UDP-3-O-(3-hydroxymyristoyl)glucosamine N-acyltransferase [Desulfonauticus sp.]